MVVVFLIVVNFCNLMKTFVVRPRYLRCSDYQSTNFLPAVRVLYNVDAPQYDVSRVGTIV